MQTASVTISDGKGNPLATVSGAARDAKKIGEVSARVGAEHIKAQMLKTTIMAVAAIDEQMELLKHSRKDTLSRLKGVVDIEPATLKRLMAERRTTEKQLAFQFEQERKAMKVWHELLDRAGMERETDE